MSTHRRLALLSLVAACGGNNNMVQPKPDACMPQSARDGCLANQQVCVDENGKATCHRCGTGTYAAVASNSCVAIGGTATSHDFSMFTTKAGEEVKGLCQSWTLGNATELWVNAVELTQDEASHHSNWTFVPSDQWSGPDGVWQCADRGYDELSAAVAGGVLYAQSTQAAAEVQKFPNGAAVRIPPYSRIISDVHLLNATSASVTGHAKLTIYTLPVADVKVKLVPFHLTYKGLNIPPHATSRFTGDCDLDSAYMSVAGTGYQAKIYYILPHTHALATRFFLHMTGGPSDGKTLIDVRGFNSEARGRAYDPPVDTAGAKGLRFGCEFTNPRDASVKWGFGDQEMCELLGFADSSLAYEAAVDTAMSSGSEGSIQLFGGACAPLAFKWDFMKPGGPPP